MLLITLFSLRKFREFFLTDTRALAIGEIFDAPPDDLQVDKLVIEILRPYTTQDPYTVSSFYNYNW